MADTDTLVALVRIVRRRLWLARIARLGVKGLWAGAVLLLFCALFHLFVYALPMLLCISLALLLLGLALAAGVLWRPPTQGQAARIADAWLDGKCLLLSAWELLKNPAQAETGAGRYVMAQARQAGQRWQNRLSRRPHVDLPTHAAAAVAISLISSFLLRTPGTEKDMSAPDPVQMLSVAMTAADPANTDAARRLKQELLETLGQLPDNARAQAIQNRQPDGEATTISAEQGFATDAAKPLSRATAGAPSTMDAALPSDMDDPAGGTATAGVAKFSGNAAGYLPAAGVATGAADNHALTASALSVRYVELERAQLADTDSAGVRRSGIEFEQQNSRGATLNRAGATAPPAVLSATPLAATLSPALRRYAADYFSALRSEE